MTYHEEVWQEHSGKNSRVLDFRISAKVFLHSATAGTGKGKGIVRYSDEYVSV